MSSFNPSGNNSILSCADKRFVVVNERKKIILMSMTTGEHLVSSPSFFRTTSFNPPQFFQFVLVHRIFSFTSCWPVLSSQAVACSPLSLVSPRLQSLSLLEASHSFTSPHYDQVRKRAANMSLADSLLHPRESTLVKGWGMQETDISDQKALYIKPIVSLSSMPTWNELTKIALSDFRLHFSCQHTNRVC